MKRLTVICSVLLFSFQSFGEVSLGVDFSSRLENYREVNDQNVNDESTTHKYTLGIRPLAIIMVTDVIEVVPFAGFSIYRENSERYQNGGKVKTEASSNGYDLGCGLYFRVINGKLLRFSIGPKATFGQLFEGGDSDAYTTFTSLSAPANIDLRLNDRFFIRTSPVLVDLSYSNYHMNEDRHTSDVNFNIITQNGISIGFFFTF